MSDMRTPTPTAVDDTRRARNEIAQGGFTSLREHLLRVREEYRCRTGPFADLPTEQPEDVRRAIEAAETGEPLIDELRGLRNATGPQRA